jgi:hypothetical protein
VRPEISTLQRLMKPVRHRREANRVMWHAGGQQAFVIGGRGLIRDNVSCLLSSAQGRPTGGVKLVKQCLARSQVFLSHGMQPALSPGCRSLPLMRQCWGSMASLCCESLEYRQKRFKVSDVHESTGTDDHVSTCIHTFKQTCMHSENTFIQILVYTFAQALVYRRSRMLS